MLYKKKADPALDPSLFRNPTSEYRCAPFWAWNDKLNAEELTRQIDEMKEMGFGGFHMHTRSGMATPYLSEEFMNLIKACNEKAKKEDMLAWLYDEDRWPSGAAGGIVTKDPKFREKYIRFTVRPLPEVENNGAWSEYVGQHHASVPHPVVKEEKTGFLEGKPYLLAAFDIVLNPNGTLKKYTMVAPGAPIQGTLWYVYALTAGCSGWYNGQAYVDTLSNEAMQRFIEVTYHAYLNAVGNDFDKSVPAIFTDEPQFIHMGTLSFANAREDVNLPWTTDLPDTFEAAYGYDLVPHLPELLWDLDGQPSRSRYLYHDHICDRFTNAFAKQCGEWCREHNLSLTGHMLAEAQLHSQSSTVGETMRAYGWFGLPGIDMLCNLIELSTAKQCQSAVHQYGKEGMTSELYGVTGWDFDFRGHKFQGDWQAALGVTVRVPHLSWYSMHGSAKRDYPASIHYQSAWYQQYPYVEDHFARLNTVLTRGKPVVNVGVIHPVESYWLAFGPSENTAEHRNQLESHFNDVINWLLRGAIDFDFISESILPGLYTPSEDRNLHVGKMSYSAIVIPDVDTLRGTTVDILNQYIAKGGKVILMGDRPQFVDAQLPTDPQALKALCDGAETVSFSRTPLLKALEGEREVEIRNLSGALNDSLIYNKRRDGDTEWLFIAHVSQTPEFVPDRVRLTLKGRVRPTVYDTLSGETQEIPYSFTPDGKTRILYTFYSNTSLLLRLEPAADDDTGTGTGSALVDLSPRAGVRPTKVLDFKDAVSYTLSEPNVLVLDMPEWSEDGEHYSPREEMLRIDVALRRKYSYPAADGRDVQPWCIPEEVIQHYPFFRFHIHSDIPALTHLASEGVSQVWLNGEAVPVSDDGYFTDRHIRTMPLPALRVGDNELIVRMPFGKRVSLENLFLLGDFDVSVTGTKAELHAPSRQLAFGSVVHQGLPFYGADVTYRIPFTLDQDADIVITTHQYKAALLTAKLDGRDIGKIVYAPYRLEADGLSAGEHILELTAHLTRVNSFNALHNCTQDKWIGPEFWYTEGCKWAYEYQLKDNGILKSPVIEVFEK